MLKNSVGTTKPPKKLSGHPTLLDVEETLSEAQASPNTKFSLWWVDAKDNSEYVLSVLRVPGREPEWRYYTGVRLNAKLLWCYMSKEASTVHKMTLSARNARPTVEPIAAAIDSRQVTTGVLNAVNPSGLEHSFSTTIGTVLSGKIEAVQITNLLQYIRNCTLTGRLNLEGPEGKSVVFFVRGAPVHAASGETIGSETILNLIGWTHGKFHFESKITTDQNTVKKSLDSLILEGVQLLDNTNFLKGFGLEFDSALRRKHESLSEHDFEAMVSLGAPLDLNLQKQFYLCIDNFSSLMEILAKVPLPRSQWVPLLASLIKCDLVAVTAPRAARGQHCLVKQKEIDDEAIRSVETSLQSAETGIFSYPAFLFFLRQEALARQRNNAPFSVIIFEMRLVRAGIITVREPLPAAWLSEAVIRIRQQISLLELFAHYETFDYALLLPCTKASQAAALAHRIVKELLDKPLGPASPSQSLSVAFGIASVPEDCSDLPTLLAAAEEAKESALKAPSGIVLYRNLG